ncbi:MAG TPA: DNA-binding domain-containing protein [Polyangiaceae bacterium]|nr:DNA-binding domain-containing protein [Polyangiaceae bacterium]
MTWPSSPEWLLELQSRFGELLRTPLDRSSGRLRAGTEGYRPALVQAARAGATLSSAERLAVYHRQYWFRLFSVLQGLYPLTSRLVGYWHFNAFAAHHVLQRPPRGFDIDTIGDDFELSLVQQLTENATVVTDAQHRIEASAVLDAARVDAAFHRVTRAPRREPLRPGPADAERFQDSCLRLSDSVALVQERWPLCELRLSFVEQQSDEAVQLAERWPEPRHWLLARHASKLGLLALEPREAELFGLLQRLPLERALGELEAAAPTEERARLPERAQAWLARSVRLGIWAAFVPPQK